jgi:hypothetical protein
LNKAWRSFGGNSFPEKSSKIIRQNSIPENKRMKRKLIHNGLSLLTAATLPK